MTDELDIAIKHADRVLLSIGFFTDAAQQMRAKGSIVGLVRTMNEVHSLTEKLGDIKTAGQRLLDSIRFSLLPDLMQEQEVENIQVEEVGKCYLTDDINVTCKDKEAMKTWLIEQGLEDLITESINAQSLTAFVRRRMKAGEELPNELLTIRPFTRAAINGKSKGEGPSG